MRRMGRKGLVLGLLAAMCSLSGFAAERFVASAGAKAHTEAIASHIAMLRSGKPQVRAAAAYWLGQQRAAAAEAVDPLVELLGDATQVNPALYRTSRALQKMTLGE